MDLDSDLEGMSREQLLGEVRKLREAIREHRDSSGMDLCWHHPKLWALLPEKVEPDIAVPEWPQFLRGASNTAKASTNRQRTRRGRPKSTIRGATGFSVDQARK